MRLFLSLFFTLAFTMVAAATEISEPPQLAEPKKYLTNEEVAFFATSPRNAWNFWRNNPVTDFATLTQRIPEIERFVVLRGNWGEPGSVRRVEFKNGGSALERVLTSNNSEFTYQIWDIKTSSGGFINHIYGEFNVRQANQGSEIVWRYNVKPANFLVRPFIGAFLRNDFAPFMEEGLQGVAKKFENKN